MITCHCSRGNKMSETVVTLDGRTFRVDPCGFYEELIEVPLDSPVMSEGGQYPERVQLYVKMHRAGSPFPPIAVAGVTPDHPRYRITNGHHRYLAARRVGAGTIRAWTCFYVPFEGANRRTCYRLARMSDTEMGRRLARLLGREWCPRCGRFLDYRPDPGVCLSCHLAIRPDVKLEVKCFQPKLRSLLLPSKR